MEAIKTADKAIPIALAANQKYVPILYTCVRSMIKNAAAGQRYEIYIFHTDISRESREVFHDRLQTTDVHVTFVNISKRVAGCRLQAKEHITTETFYRFLILDILKDYPKVIYLDCDMIICRDIAKLYDTDLGDCLAAAALDPDFAGQCNMAGSDMAGYCKKTLGLEDPFQYFQAGVLVLNVAKLRGTVTVQQLFRMADTGIYRFSDQDILNIVCKGRVKYLDMSWNMMTDCGHFRWKKVIRHAPAQIREAYQEAREHPYIIHYAGYLKPWMKPDEDFGYVFWEMARATPYYEMLLQEMCQYGMVQVCGRGNKAGAAGAVPFRLMRKVFMKVLPQGSRLRRKLGQMYWGIFGP